jgi:hypothetical protein
MNADPFRIEPADGLITITAGYTQGQLVSWEAMEPPTKLTSLGKGFILLLGLALLLVCVLFAKAGLGRFSGQTPKRPLVTRFPPPTD